MSNVKRENLSTLSFHVSRLMFHVSLILTLLLPLVAALASDLDDGMALFVSGDYDRAKEKFAAYLSSHPDDPTTLYHLGLTEPDALKSKYCFERLIETHPDYPGADAATFEIGLFYYVSPFNLSGLAREEFQRLLRDYPRSPFVPRAHYHLGLISVGDGAYASARESFRKAIQADAGGEVAPFARAAVAESYLLDDKYDLAIREAEDAWPQKRMAAAAGRLLAIAADACARKGQVARADSLQALLVGRFPDSDDAARIAPARNRPTSSPSISGVNEARPPVQTESPKPVPSLPAAQRPDTTKKEALTRTPPEHPSHPLGAQRPSIPLDHLRDPPGRVGRRPEPT